MQEETMWVFSSQYKWSVEEFFRSKDDANTTKSMVDKSASPISTNGESLDTKGPLKPVNKSNKTKRGRGDSVHHTP